MQQQHDEAGKHDANTLLTTKGASLRLEDVISGPQGWRLFNVNFAPLFMPLERRLQTLAVSLQFGIFLFSGVISILTMVYLFFFTSSLKFIPLLYLAWMAYDWDTGEKGGRNNRFARGWWLWRYSARYFPVRVVKTTELDPNKSYLLGCHPHGILSFGIALAFSTDALKIEEIFPGLRFSLFTLPINFQMPGLREVALGLGMRSSSKASMEFALRSPKGSANVLVVGGAKEALNYEPESIKLVLNCRKGFIKLALRFGRDLVPVFDFGENFLFTQTPNPEGSLLRNFQDWLEQKITYSTPIFRGRGYFQYDYGIIPQRKPLNVIIGEPIPVTKIENPTRQEVEELHARYVEAVLDLYDKYNPVFGDPNVKLEIS